MTFEGKSNDFGDRRDRFVKEEVADLAHSMMNLLRPYSEIIRPDFVEDLEGFVDHHELEKIKNRNIDEKLTEQTIISLKNQLELNAKQLGANTTMDVSINGKTSYHKADLIVERSEKSYVIIFEYLNFYVLDGLIRQLIFDAVDITKGKNQKVVFVYLGHFRAEAIEALRHYYDAVVHFDHFREYLSKELGYYQFFK
jgi:hypothetical protein